MRIFIESATAVDSDAICSSSIVNIGLLENSDNGASIQVDCVNGTSYFLGEYDSLKKGEIAKDLLLYYIQGMKSEYKELANRYDIEIQSSSIFSMPKNKEIHI